MLINFMLIKKRVCKIENKTNLPAKKNIPLDVILILKVSNIVEAIYYIFCKVSHSEHNFNMYILTLSISK